MFRQSIIFHFSNSNIGFNALYRSCAKEYFNKEQKQIRKKTNKKNIWSYKKSPLYKEKWNVNTFSKTFSSSVSFVLVFQTKFLKNFYKTFRKKNSIFFLFLCWLSVSTKTKAPFIKTILVVYFQICSFLFRLL